MNTHPQKIKKNNIKKIFFTWAIYFFIIVAMITLSPYNFELDAKGKFSWVINTFDMFENLFLLFPIGFFLTLASDKIKLIDIIKFTFIGFIFSASVEFSQLFLKSRSSQYWDVIGNTISIVLGILVGICVKPLANKLIITRSSIATLISTLFAISILLIIRLMMNNQKFGLLEFSLLVCASGILTLLFSYYSIKNNNMPASITAVITIIFVLVSLSPLLLTNITLLLMLSLFFGLIVPTCVYFMSATHAISQSNKQKILLTLTYPPIIVFSVLAIINLLTINSGFSILELDRLYKVNEGRGVGGIIVQVFLLLTITIQLLSYILSTKKYNPK